MTSNLISVANFEQLYQTAKKLSLDKEVIGFDIFDTLLRRKVEPEYIKDIVAKYMGKLLNKEEINVDIELLRQKRRDLEIYLGTQNELKGEDHEFLYDDLIIGLYRQFSSLKEEKVNELYLKTKNFELQLEKDALCLTPNIEQLLNDLKRSGKKLLFISDMYLSIEMIRELLKHFDIEKYFDDGYCSSQFNKKKMTGKLFDYVLEQESINPAKMLFIGDNYYSDVEMTSQRGITAIHINDIKEKKRKSGLQLVEWAFKKDVFWSGKLIHHMIHDIPTRVQPGKSCDYDLGLLVAPILVQFVEDLIENCRAMKINQIYFLAREGKVFMDIYHEIIKNNPSNLSYPKASYLYVSRKATFLPSIDSLEWEELNRFLHQYSTQSINSFLNNLNLPAHEYYEYAFKVGFKDFDLKYTQIEQNEQFRAFIEMSEVRDLFEKHQKQAKAIFIQYLNEHQMFEHEQVAFVDIGWKGTIQDSIAKAIEKENKVPVIQGFYMGLLNSPMGTTEKSLKYGFFADFKNMNYIENVIFKNGSLFEMCTTPNHGTTIGYKIDERRVVPVLQDFEVEKENYKNYFEDVFKAIDDYVRDYSEIRNLIFFNPVENKLFFADQIRRYILYPTKKEAKNFLRYSHVESFGVDKVTTYELQGSFVKAVFKWPFHKGLSRVTDLVRMQIWPEGVLKRSNIPFINFVYDYVSTKRQ